VKSTERLHFEASSDCLFYPRAEQNSIVKNPPIFIGGFCKQAINDAMRSIHAPQACITDQRSTSRTEGVHHVPKERITQKDIFGILRMNSNPCENEILADARVDLVEKSTDKVYFS